MRAFDGFDWCQGSAEEHLAMARTGQPDQICELARGYDWFLHPETVLGWIMAQKCVDLGTAMIVFLNGEPERFNYIPSGDIPHGYRGILSLLDNICRRVNCGFYLADLESPRPDRRRIAKWIAYQAADRAEGQMGRWRFDEHILEPMLTDPACLSERAEVTKPASFLDLFGPLISRAGQRMIKDRPRAKAIPK